MALFNLLPLYPLDGYRILAYFLKQIFDPLYVFDLLFYTSLLIELILIIVLFFFRLYFLILVLFFLMFKLQKSRQEERNKININTIISLLK